jgi:DNA polymerase III subunit epsilon
MASRLIMLDTETTGLHASMGDRIIEVGCVELLGRSVTERHFHRYLNPGREIEEGALKVHGITKEFLLDKPKFAEIAREFLDYVQGADLVIHNAGFDVEFIDMELKLAGLGKLSESVASIIDSLAMARELHPGKKNSLDALCERYMVNNAHRTLHGALLDARLLAEVYLSMTRGQESLVMELESPGMAAAAIAMIELNKLVVVAPTVDELAAHESYLDALDKAAKGGSVWRRLG